MISKTGMEDGESRHLGMEDQGLPTIPPSHSILTPGRPTLRHISFSVTDSDTQLVQHYFLLQCSQIIWAACALDSEQKRTGCSSGSFTAFNFSVIHCSTNSRYFCCVCRNAKVSFIFDIYSQFFWKLCNSDNNSIQSFFLSLPSNLRCLACKPEGLLGRG